MRRRQVEEILGWTADATQRRREREAQERADARAYARRRELCVSCGAPAVIFGKDGHCAAHPPGEADRCG